jgi:uncharacterized protein YjdB
VKNGKGKTTYKSSNAKVAKVSSKGVVTAIKAGTAKITVANNGAKAVFKVTVIKKSQKISGLKKSYVKSYGSKKFSLGCKASGKTKLTYTSSNKKVATVSSSGKVTVKNGGTAVITVKTSGNTKYKGATAKTKIIVIPKNFSAKDITGVNKYGNHGVKILWKKTTGASGYTVQYSTNNNFITRKEAKCSKNNKSVTITGLKKGVTYYVRMRTYISVSGKKYVGKWCTINFKAP